MSNQDTGMFPIMFHSGQLDDNPRTFHFHYTEHSVVEDVMKACTYVTNMDMSDYVLYAEYPIIPRCIPALFEENFKQYTRMPASSRNSNFVRLLYRALALSAQHPENKKTALYLDGGSMTRLIRINIVHRDFV
ncbi:hypothetical protein GGI15_000417 [Coemansia interrupta]|uniref:Uncharacterized protein n=1 Tax=Coemansia interrupta TaxID=1126814 RepID=A0A9W8HS66_9FUNG|nr:hypothetical protein GGI15_000417 [Coemansia interrupta]